MDRKLVRSYRESFVKGPVSPEFIAAEIARHNEKHSVGALDIFLGQVREDVHEGQPVRFIEYTAYEEMAHELIAETREEMMQRFQLKCLHIYHSLGRVDVGRISLFIMACAEHREDAMVACRETVEWIKRELPVWGKEFVSEEAFLWKKNNHHEQHHP